MKNLRLDGVSTVSPFGLNVSIEDGGDITHPGQRVWGGFISIESFMETVNKAIEILGGEVSWEVDMLCHGVCQNLTKGTLKGNKVTCHACGHVDDYEVK